jgi:hypothetical protein
MTRMSDNLRRYNLAIYFSDKGGTQGGKPDKTQIFWISCFRRLGWSNVIPRERHSGHMEVD